MALFFFLTIFFHQVKQIDCVGALDIFSLVERNGWKLFQAFNLKKNS
jgi:hypothetical protein